MTRAMSARSSIARGVMVGLSFGGLFASPAWGEEGPMDAAGLAHALMRLEHTGRVLYVAAHPDDENTRLLTFLAGHRHLTAAYLSLTRGGGGQNLIGSEQDELLGVIRTEELSAARRLDGARQYFTRMRDFGYSKTADETFSAWGRDEALADVVWVIRSFQPDVIVTRFDERPPNHGHHTASAILAREAFAAAADPARFPEQLGRGVSVWQAARVLHNVPSWTGAPPPEHAMPLEVGAYDPWLGLASGELAARSRSQHKSQGFGVPGERGGLREHFVTVAGEPPKDDLLEGVDPSWVRFGEAGRAFGGVIARARAGFDPRWPERILPELLEAHLRLEALPAGDVRVRDARAALERAIFGAAGLFARATAAMPGAAPGQKVPVKLEVVLQRPAEVTVERVRFPHAPPLTPEAAGLPLNERRLYEAEVSLPAGAAPSSPHWLAALPDGARHRVVERDRRADPVGPPALAVQLELSLGGRSLTLEAPVLYGWTDRVHGERLRRFLVVPPATVTPVREAVSFPDGRAQPVDVRVRAGRDGVRGRVRLPLPKGWRVAPAAAPVSLARAGEEVTVRFTVTPPRRAAPVNLGPTVEVDGKRWSLREDVIDYAHIPVQVVLRPATLRLVPLSLRLPKGLVGYVDGSGDTIPEDLAHVGLEVQRLDDEALRSGDLSRFAAILVGIRAYNTREVLKSAHPRLMAYVEGGGTVLVQYQTVSRWSPLEQPLGPFPLEVGRSRITDEAAQVLHLAPKSPLLAAPNRIGPEDWAGWVQERGLYFAEKWDDRYEPLFELADPGEAPLRGGLLVARHGRGRYIYTGLAFFRQLPAGVPGAYRLLANLIAGR